MGLMKKISAAFRNRKLQVITAALLTLSLLIIAPTYSWFKKQQEMARYEKVRSVNTLYITAASREDVKSFQIAGVDVSEKALWDLGNSQTQRKTYQDYVFCVAGDYVYSYTLQLAHTTNNNYRYEIFEAEAMGSPPAGGVPERDYIEYKITEDYDPAILSEITAKDIYTTKAAGDGLLYYRIKKADNSVPVSLNAVNPTQNDKSLVTPSTYTVGGETVTYNGHFLNRTTDFSANNTYHNDTYSEDEDKVDGNAEPLYWQANGISGGDVTNSDSFYHEYILRISWDVSGNNAATTDYKDTDIIYVMAKAD